MTKFLGPLVYMDEQDENAKKFDNLMYALMITLIEGSAQFKRGKKQLIKICQALSARATIDAIRIKLEFIKMITQEEFWQNPGILDFEKVRVELRGLINLIIDEGDRNPVYTNLEDPVLDIKVGDELEAPYDFEDYRLKVNRYIEQHREHIAIHKLRNNIPLTTLDYKALEHILTGELGTPEDYQREFKDTPFGLLVRQIAGLELEAVNAVFSEFITDQSLTQAQIVFVRKIIDHFVQHGEIEKISDLTKPPFDTPQSFVKLFDGSKQRKIVDLVNLIKNNAVKTVG